jgi:Flp pilus assembly protein TadG
VKATRICSDESGASAIEFGLTAPLFFMIVLGIIEAGLFVWSQAGLQHAAEMAARCATVNATTCPNTSAIQNFAVQQAYGLSFAPSVFSVTTPACGNQVSATYTYQFITSYFGAPTLTLNAQSCFPK